MGIIEKKLQHSAEKDNAVDYADMFASHYLKEAAVSAELAQRLQPERHYTVLYGNLNKLPEKVHTFVEENAKVCQPDYVHICDGSEKEITTLTYMLQKDGMIKPLPKYENCWLARTDPGDVARVESKTVISTEEKYDTVPHTSPG